MQEDLIQRVLADPNHQQLKARRSSYGWWLALAMMVVHYGFILLVTFDKELLAQRLGSGVKTLGIPVGFGVIVFTIVITAICVRRANTEFDALSDTVTKAAFK